MNQQINIKKLTHLADLQEVQRLDHFIWTNDSVPVHQTYTAVNNGGLILGAYDGQQLIGFSYGFPGFQRGMTYLCSHMLGIHPNYRKQGIGEKLKEAQKKEALELGYSLITWTFDPLESVNAYLNIHKLRGIGQRYLENHYGQMKDPLNNGLPSDRFIVYWWIKSGHVHNDHLKSEENILANHRLLSTAINEQGLPFITNDHFNRFNEEKTTWLVPIPYEIQKIKEHDLELALQWRYHTRKVFQQLFAKGYVAVDVHVSPKEHVSYYVLKKEETLIIE